MPNAPDINKRHVGLRIELETCYMVEKKYGRPGDTSRATAFIRALEDSVKGVVLDAADYDAITLETKANEKKRK